MFGAKSTSFSFGSPQTSAASTTPLFGAQSAATSKPMFGSLAPQVSQPSLFGGTSTVGSTTPKLFASSTTTPSLFGTSTTTTAPTGGLFGTTTTSGGLFGKPGTTFGSTTTTAFGGAKPLFGGAVTAQPTSALGTRASLQSIVQNSEALIGSVTKVELYGDERDKTITNLNQIAASLGVGRAMYRKDQSVEFNKLGPFYRLKTTGYNADSSHTDDEGLVMLILNVPHSQVSSSQQRQAVVDEIFKIMENKPELKAHIERVQPLTDKTTKIVLYVTQQDLGRVKATQLAAFFQQPNKKMMLENQLRVNKDSISALIAMDSNKKKLYLSTVPQGFDESSWNSSIRQNPNPSKLIPYPIRGFDEVIARQKVHFAQVDSQNAFIDSMSNRCKQLESSLASSEGRCAACRTMQKQLSHRLLRIMAVSELSNRFGHGIDKNEEEMQTVLEAMNAKLNAPNGMKNRLSSMEKTVSSEGDSLKSNGSSSNPLTTSHITQLKRYLNKCQDGLESLSEMVNRNMDELRIMDKYTKIM